MSNLEEVKEQIRILTSSLETLDMPSERETELSGKVVALCAAIGTNLSVDEAVGTARNMRTLISELESQVDVAKLDISQVSSEDLVEEVCRRMNVAVEDLARS